MTAVTLFGRLIGVVRLARISSPTEKLISLSQNHPCGALKLAKPGDKAVIQVDGAGYCSIEVLPGGKLFAQRMGKPAQSGIARGDAYMLSDGRTFTIGQLEITRNGKSIEVNMKPEPRLLAAGS